MTQIRRAFLLLLLLCPVACLSARAESPDEIPNPRQARRSWVADNAEVLNAQTVSRLDDLISTLQAKTGDEIAVVTVHDLGGMSVEEFANRLFNRWGVGKKNRDNGVLLLAAIDDHKMRIEVGDGLEAKLSDARAGYIIREVIAPRFKADDFDGGVLDGARAIARRLNAAPNSANAAPAVKKAAAKTSAPKKLAPKTSTAKTLKAPVKTASKTSAKPQVAPFRAPVSSDSPFDVPSSGVSGAPISSVPSGGGLPLGAPLLMLAVLGGGGLLAWVGLSSRAPKCPRCNAAMGLVPEGEEDAFLTEIQQLEEQMGGREWNVWRCPKDGFQTILPHDKMFSAVSNCPRCRCHTATSQTQNLCYASEFQEGLEQTAHLCHNPRCGYNWTTQRTIPRITPAPIHPSHAHGHDHGFSSSHSSIHSSHSHSSHSDSGGSFGGGSSSGGGASGSW